MISVSGTQRMNIIKSEFLFIGIVAESCGLMSSFSDFIE